MIKIIYNLETKIFGIQADRVKSGMEQKLMDLYYEDGDPELIDRLEDYTGNPYRTSSSTPERIKRLDRKLNPDAYLNEGISDDELSEFKRSIERKQRSRKLPLKYNGDRNSELAKKVIESAPEDIHISDTPYENDSGAVIDSVTGEIKVSKKSSKSPSTLAHEIAHYEQFRNPNYRDQDISPDKIDLDLDAVSSMEPDEGVDEIYNYINHQLNKESDANYRSLMRLYKLGASRKQLRKSYRDLVAGNKSYEANLLGYNSPNLNYNMDHDTYEKFQKNKSNL